MSYWIYENWVAESKAVIHNTSCGYCNEGRGCHKDVRGNNNGKWHGPFTNYEEAEVNARNTGRPVKHCRNRICR